MSVSNVFGGRFVAIPAWSIGYIARHGQPRDLMVLANLVEMMNVHTKIVDASIPRIAEVSNTSKETVKRSLKWLAEHHVVSVIARPKPSNNVYKINYKQKVMGSPMTPYGVTSDPINGSPMTPLDMGNGVTGDPIKSDETPGEEANIQTPRIVLILDNEIEKVKRVASDDGKVDEMIFGSDPEEVKTEKPKQQDKRTPRPEVNDLASYFVYHPRSVMSCTYTPQDMNILRRSIRLLLDGGLVRSSIRQMIDKFFNNERFAQADSPVLMFSSKSVQQSLMSSTGISLDNDTDPVLVFMVNDFTRGDLSLPWLSTMDTSLRETIIMHGMDVCYRYPELVAEVIRKFSSDFADPDFPRCLEALNSLVLWHTGDEDGDPEKFRYSVSSLSLPKELLANNKSSIRPASDTIASAIYTYRRLSKPT